MRHLQAFGQLDVDGIVADYAEDATVITADGVHSGKEEIRDFYEGLVGEFSQDGISMETQALVFEGKLAFLIWNGESPDNVYEVMTDTYLVEDGMIVSQTFGGKMMAK